MDAQRDLRQYLLCATAGYACLACSLLVYSVEVALVRAGWLPNLTPNAVIGVATSILFLFPASLAYARMLSRQPTLGAENTPEPFNSRGLVVKTALFTLAIALVTELFAVGRE